LAGDVPVRNPAVSARAGNWTGSCTRNRDAGVWSQAGSRKTQTKKGGVRKMYVCNECGSDQIREAVFVWYNTREEIGNVFDDVWCEQCDCEVTIKEEEE
tara:strand:- start:55 stop:351 length:297 start_codon:yes stop_codon:yes gene_type:complete